MMKKSVPAANPDAYVKALKGWQHTMVETLRSAVCGAAKLEEVVKWGHLVYFTDGPALLIRAEEQRVLVGFWRGQLLREIEPRLKPGGKYAMATLELKEGETISVTRARQLVRKAVELNRTLGDPTKVIKSKDQRKKQ
jgi:hypothetical protein